MSRTVQERIDAIADEMTAAFRGRGPIGRSSETTIDDLMRSVEALTAELEAGRVSTGDAVHLRLVAARLAQGVRREASVRRGSEWSERSRSVDAVHRRLRVLTEAVESDGRTWSTSQVGEVGDQIDELALELLQPVRRSGGRDISHLTSMRDHLSFDEQVGLTATRAAQTAALCLFMACICGWMVGALASNAGVTADVAAPIGVVVALGLFVLCAALAASGQASGRRKWDQRRASVDATVARAVAVLASDTPDLADGHEGAPIVRLANGFSDLATVLTASGAVGEPAASRTARPDNHLEDVTRVVLQQRDRLGVVRSSILSRSGRLGSSTLADLSPLTSQSLVLVEGADNSRVEWQIFDSSWIPIGMLVATRTAGGGPSARSKCRRYSLLDRAGRIVLSVSEPQDDRHRHVSVVDHGHLPRTRPVGRLSRADVARMPKNPALVPIRTQRMSGARAVRIDLDLDDPERPLLVARWLLCRRGAPQRFRTAPGGVV